MDKLLIEGGTPLSGEAAISGAKNAALPLLCAALLTREPLTLTNVPNLNDVGTMLKLLEQMGVRISREKSAAGLTLTLDASGPALGYATLARPYLDQPLGWGDTRWVNFQTGASSNLNYPFMSEDFKTPLVQSYNLNIQYEFLPRWIFQVG